MNGVHCNQFATLYRANLRECKSQRQDFPFTFDKIRRHRGEAAKEIGLHQGVEVQFSEMDGLIDFVDINPAQKS